MSTPKESRPLYGPGGRQAKEPYTPSTPEDRARRRGNWDASLATGQKRQTKPWNGVRP